MDAGVPVFIIFAFLVGMFVFYKKGNDILQWLSDLKDKTK